ncbi:MAG: HD-GYP domain-containing protein [Vicinamibacterales bacterium]
MADPHTASSVLIAHHDARVGHDLRDTLASDGHRVHVVHDRLATLYQARTGAPDVLLVSVELAGRHDFDLCRQLRFDARTRLVPLILVSDHADQESRVRGLEAGADDFVSTPVDRAELLARVRSLTRLKRYTDEMDSAAAIITTLAVMIESRDGYAEGHCHRMANYATALGRALGLADADLQALHRGGFLHDIGMLAIPDAVLRKQGPLTAEEYRQIQSHTRIGDELCGNLRSLHAIRPIVRSHHERLDGSGYPDGLRGDSIPLLAQIIAIADVFDAITTRRAYREEQPASHALEVLRQHVARGWHREDLVTAFTDLVVSGKVGALVEA